MLSFTMTRFGKIVRALRKGRALLLFMGALLFIQLCNSLMGNGCVDHPHRHRLLSNSPFYGMLNWVSFFAGVTFLVFTLGFLLHCNLVGDVNRCIPLSQWVGWAAVGCGVVYAVSLPWSAGVPGALDVLESNGKSDKVWKCVGNYFAILFSNILLKPLALVAVPFQILLAMFGILSKRVNSCDWIFKLFSYWNYKSGTLFRDIEWDNEMISEELKKVTVSRAFGWITKKVMQKFKDEDETSDRVRKDIEAEAKQLKQDALDPTKQPRLTMSVSLLYEDLDTPHSLTFSVRNPSSSCADLLPDRRRLFSPQFSKLCEKMGIG